MTAHRKTCDKCANYERSKATDYAYCNVMGDSNDGPVPIDGCVGWDYEGYRSGTYVGPKFGCIHWVKIVKENK